MALSIDAILSAVELSLYGHNIARTRNNDIKQEKKMKNFKSIEWDRAQP
ncbi:uncharacterized protein FMAN_00612 [Fusarium mangiferae]|uniref:Uncharacterized protein n=1 Tax=Fusarium mangiferae TaxID=192010 RepID=A0A1L7S941_FUSMA|nr:uncharacterized protein FMAN_00612 [Fusarium mangiferae]CVK82971.1 uncharacterized protein FMAN_00612 [Fusarium mangiferae]